MFPPSGHPAAQRGDSMKKTAIALALASVLMVSTPAVANGYCLGDSGWPTFVQLILDLFGNG